jgi:ATP-dependent Zn protease
MVARYGMSPRLGPVRLLVGGRGGFLGDDLPLADLSPDTQLLVEEETRRLIEEAIGTATEILTTHRDHFDQLVERLTIEETLEEETLNDALTPLLGSLDHAGAGPGA